MAPIVAPSAPPMAAGASGGPVAAAAAVAAGEVPASGMDAEIVSEDSLILTSESPPVQREAQGPRASRAPSPGQSTSALGSKSPTRRGLAMARLFIKSAKSTSPGRFRSSSTPRSKMRPPSLPRQPIRDPQVVPAQAGGPQGSGSVEERLSKLEAQGELDHQFLRELTNAMRGLNETNDKHRQGMFLLETQQNEHAAMDLQLRQAMAAARGKAESDILEAARITSSALDTKFIELKDNIERTRNELQLINGRENQVAEYLNELKGERPQEGQVVLGFFKHVENELILLKQQLQHNPVGAVVAPSPVAAVFTEEMRVGLEKIHNHIVGMDQGLAGLNGSFAEVQQRVISAETEILKHGEVLTAWAAWTHQEHTAPKLNLTAAFRGGACGSGACGDRSCGGGNPFAVAPPPGVPAQLPPGVPAAAGGHGGGGGADGGTQLRAIIGGNGICHCEHVRLLQEKVERIEQAGRAAAGDPRGPDRLVDAWNLYSKTPTRQPPGDVPRAAPQNLQRVLPLQLRGPLGAIGYKERSLFDEKLASQSEYKFDGVKGGIAWKGRLERMIIARAPILKDVLEWAEGEELHTVTPERFLEAVGDKLTEDQVLTTNAALWGFLSACLSGTAETIFKNGETLNGLDAWRRVTRFIEHGRSMRLENLRSDVNQMRQRQIRGLEKVEEGIAEFETLLRDYHEAGGTKIEDGEKKSDLLAILPVEIREHLLWYATDSNRSFLEFRDLVLTQTNKILHTRRKLPTHGMVDDSHGDAEEHAAIPLDQPINSIEDLIAVINRLQNRGGNRFNRNQQNGWQPPPPKAIGDRPPRKCANCGQTHPGPCGQPRVPPDQRPCWRCGKKGHVSAKCTEAGKPGAIKAIEDGSTIAAVDHRLRAFFMVQDAEGFTQVGGKRSARRPQPQMPVVADFMSKNSFETLKTSDKRSHFVRSSSCGARLRVPADEAVAPKPPAVENIIGNQKMNEVAYIKEQDGGSDALRRALLDAQRIADEAIESAINDPKISAEEFGRILDHPHDHEQGIKLISDEPDEILATTERVVIKPAIDSGAVDNVIHPRDLPADSEPEPNLTGKHYVGPKGERIDKYGCCATRLEGPHGTIGCNWQLADVTRPLHSVSQVTGPADGPGKQDVLFNNKRCVVVPPGVVDRILKEVKPITEYHREGNLYLAEMTMSSFGRQGQVA